jgi:cyclase
VSRHCFVPLTAGGWIVDEDYAKTLLRSGADKLVVNTAVADDPKLVTALSLRFGRQCIVASMDIKRADDNRSTVYVDRGRRDTGKEVAAWARRACELGAGEILFNSIDHDGARKGYELKALRQVCEAVDVPVIAFGGVFTWQHLVDGIGAGADAVAAANIFHYSEQATRKAKAFMAQSGVLVRREGRELA